MTFEEWMDEFIAINSNPKLKMVGIPITRREYYNTYFSKGFEPREIYEQYQSLERIK